MSALRSRHASGCRAITRQAEDTTVDRRAARTVSGQAELGQQPERREQRARRPRLRCSSRRACPMRLPIWLSVRTACRASSGSVAPISTVGTASATKALHEIEERDRRSACCPAARAGRRTSRAAASRWRSSRPGTSTHGARADPQLQPGVDEHRPPDARQPAAPRATRRARARPCRRRAPWPPRARRCRRRARTGASRPSDR